MTATGEGLPADRYGRSSAGLRHGGSQARADRTLKIVGAVLGAGLLAVVAWSGVSYISGQKVSGELIKFKVVSDTAVEAHLEVRKDADTAGVCTLRAQAEDGGEVGRKDIRFDEREGRVDKVATVVTTRRATAVELIGCTSATSG
ncbi:DUF4307 domain-containing protein [Streptomyces sp. KR80]|uniref:DUF4307 domain-containing protein n=1 Tax=Streptomyces sp. KR80 TaxID=3457426 RepID=UPI003FD0EE8E